MKRTIKPYKGGRSERIYARITKEAKAKLLSRVKAEGYKSLADWLEAQAMTKPNKACSGRLETWRKKHGFKSPPPLTQTVSPLKGKEMKLTLDREDLKPEFQSVNCSQTKFEHFTLQAQQAIREVGRAQFREYDGSNYNAIYPPTFDEIMKGKAG